MTERGVVLVAGASGLIGRALCAALRDRGWKLRVLVRRAPTPQADEAYWNPARGEIDPAALNGVSAVVNLSGESIAGERWSAGRKALLRESRLASTRLLVRAIGQSGVSEGAFLSTSAVGYYGNSGEEIVAEEAANGAGFLAQLAKDWEEAAAPAQDAGWRVVQPRFGVVLAKEGGAFPVMRRPSAWGLGARLGSGRQWQSPIHLDDAVAALAFLLERPDLSGPFNLTAPEPIRQADFARLLAKGQRRPNFLFVPGFALKALMGEMAEELLLSSCRAVPARLLAQGFRFAYPDPEAMLRALLSP